MGVCSSSEGRHRAGGATGERGSEPPELHASQQLPRHHKGGILGIVSVSETEFATCGEDKSLALYSHVACAQEFAWTGHKKAVNRAVYGPKSKLLYSCSRDTNVCQWTTRQEAPLQIMEGHGLTCSAVALDTTERVLCSGSRDTSLRLWDVETARQVSTKAIARNLVTCLKYVPGEDLVVQAGEDLRLRVWDCRQGSLSPAQTMTGYTYFPLCLDVASDAHHILTSSKGFNGVGCEARVWDRRTGKLMREFTGHTQDATACAFLPPEATGGVPLIVTASKDETLKIYDQNTGVLLVDHAEPGCGMYSGISVAPRAGTNACNLYASTVTGGLAVFELESGGEALALRRRAHLPGEAIT